MSTLTTKSNAQTNRWLYPALADLIGIGLFLLLNPVFEQRFSRAAADLSALTDAFVLVLPYVLFLIGVHQIRRLRGESASFLSNRLILGLLAVPLALALTVAIADLSGYLDSMFTIDFGDMGNGYYFLTTPAVYLFVGLLYFFVLIQPIHTPTELSPRLIGPFVLINLFAVATASYLNVTLLGFTPLVKWLLIAAILLFFFMLPRIIYATKSRSFVSAVSLDIFLLIVSLLLLRS